MKLNWQWSTKFEKNKNNFLEVNFITKVRGRNNNFNDMTDIFDWSVMRI